MTVRPFIVLLKSAHLTHSLQLKLQDEVFCGKCKASSRCLHVLWQNDGSDLLLHDVLQAQHHSQLALHLLPVGVAFCQVAHRLEGHRAIKGHTGPLQRHTARHRCDNKSINTTPGLLGSELLRVHVCVCVKVLFKCLHRCDVLLKEVKHTVGYKILRAHGKCGVQT